MLRFLKFTGALKAKDIYTKDFIERMREAEEDVKKGNVETHSNTEEFIKSLS